MWGLHVCHAAPTGSDTWPVLTDWGEAEESSPLRPGSFRSSLPQVKTLPQ